MSRDLETFVHSGAVPEKTDLQFQSSEACSCILRNTASDDKMSWADNHRCFELLVEELPWKSKDFDRVNEDGEIGELNLPSHCDLQVERPSSAVLVYSLMENGLSCTLTDSSDSGITCTHNRENLSLERMIERNRDCACSEENSFTDSQKAGPLASMGSQLSEEFSEDTCFSSSEPIATDNDCAREHVHTSTPSPAVVDSFRTSCGLCVADSWETVPEVNVSKDSDHEHNCSYEKTSDSVDVGFNFNKSSHTLNTKLTNRKSAFISRGLHQRKSNLYAYKHKRGRYRRIVKVKRVISIKKGLRSSRSDDCSVTSLRTSKMSQNNDVGFASSTSVVSFVPETQIKCSPTSSLCSNPGEQAPINQVDDATDILKKPTLPTRHSYKDPESSQHHISGDPFNPTLLSEAKDFVTFAKDITDSRQLVEVLHKQLSGDKNHTDCGKKVSILDNSSKEYAIHPSTKACSLPPELRLLIAQSATDIHNDILAQEEAALATDPTPTKSNLCAPYSEAKKQADTNRCFKSLTAHLETPPSVMSNESCPLSPPQSCNADLLAKSILDSKHAAHTEECDSVQIDNVNHTNTLKCKNGENDCVDSSSFIKNNAAGNGLTVDCNLANSSETSAPKYVESENSMQPRGIPIVQLSFSECPAESVCEIERITSPVPNANFLSVTPPFSPVELKRSLSNTDIQQSLQKEVPSGEEDSKFSPALSSPFKVRTNSWPEPSQLSLDQLDSEIRDLQEGLKEELVNEVMVQMGQDDIDLTEVSQCLKDVLDSYPSNDIPYETIDNKHNSPLDQSDTNEHFSDSLDETDDNRRLKRAHFSYQSLSSQVVGAKCRKTNNLSSHASSFSSSHHCSDENELLHLKSSDSGWHNTDVTENSISPKCSKKLIRQRASLCLCQESDTGGPSEDGGYSDDSLVERCQRHSKKCKTSKSDNSTIAGSESSDPQSLSEDTPSLNQFHSPSHITKPSPKSNKLSPTSMKRSGTKRSPRSKRRLERLTKVTCSTELDEDLQTADTFDEPEFILTVVDGHASMTSSAEYPLQDDEVDVEYVVETESQAMCTGSSRRDSCLAKIDEAELEENERIRLEKEMPQIFITRPSIPNGVVSPEAVSEIEEFIEGITDEDSVGSYVDEFESDNSDEDEDDSEEEDETDEDEEEIEERYYIPINASMHVQPEASVCGSDAMGQLRTMAEVGLSPVNLCPDSSTSSPIEEEKVLQSNLCTVVEGSAAVLSGQSLSGMAIQSTKIVNNESHVADGTVHTLREGRENSTSFHPNHIGELDFVNYTGLQRYENNGLPQLPVNGSTVTKQQYTASNMTENLAVETNSWEALDTISPCGSDSYTFSSDTSHEDVFADSHDIHMSPVDMLIDYRILSPSERRRLYTIPEMSSEYSSTPSDGVIGSIEFEAISALEDGASVIEFCDNDVSIGHNSTASEVNDTGYDHNTFIDGVQQISSLLVTSSADASSSAVNTLTLTANLSVTDDDNSLLLSQEPVTKLENGASEVVSSCSHNSESLKHADKLPSEGGENARSLHLKCESELKVNAAAVTGVVLDSSCDLGTSIQHDSCLVESPGQLITQAADQQPQSLAASSDQSNQPESGECRELWKLYKRFSEESDEEEKEENQLGVDTVTSDAVGSGTENDNCVKAAIVEGESALCVKLESVGVEPSPIDYSCMPAHLECQGESSPCTEEEKMVMHCSLPLGTKGKVVSLLRSESSGPCVTNDGLIPIEGATPMEGDCSEVCSNGHSEPTEEKEKKFTHQHVETSVITDKVKINKHLTCSDEKKILPKESEKRLESELYSTHINIRVGEQETKFSEILPSDKGMQDQENTYSTSEESSCGTESTIIEILTKDSALVDHTLEFGGATCSSNSSIDESGSTDGYDLQQSVAAVSLRPGEHLYCADIVQDSTNLPQEIVGTESPPCSVQLIASDSFINCKDSDQRSHIAVQNNSGLLHQNSNQTYSLTFNECEIKTNHFETAKTDNTIHCSKIANIKDDPFSVPEAKPSNVVCLSDIDVYIDTLFTDALSQDHYRSSTPNKIETTACEDVNSSATDCTIMSDAELPSDSELFVSTWSANNLPITCTEDHLLADEYSDVCERKIQTNDDTDSRTVNEITGTEKRCSVTQLINVVNTNCKLLPAIEISSVKSPTRVHEFSSDVTPRSQFLYPASEESERGRERSITPDSLESLCRDTTSALLPAGGGNHHSLTSWCSHHTTGNHFTIRSKPMTKAPAYRAARHRNLDLGTFNDLWGASSDSITFVFVGPGPCNGLENQGYDRQRPNSSLSDSDAMPYNTIGLYPYFKSPCSILPRSVSLDCIHLQRHYGMPQLTARAASMESMVPEDLMGVVERGRLHEIDLEELNGKSVTSNCSPSKSDLETSQIPWSPNLVAKCPTKYVWCCGKAFSQGSVADESSADKTSHSFRKCKKSVSWSDLSGYELVNDAESPGTKHRKPRFLKPIIKKLETPLVEHPPDNAFPACNLPASDVPTKDDNRTDYTDNDVDEDLMNSALYKRIQKRANPQAWMQSRPPTASFSLKLPDHVKARIGRPTSESTTTESSADSQTDEVALPKNCETKIKGNLVFSADDYTNEVKIEGHEKLLTPTETTRGFSQFEGHTNESSSVDPPILSQVLTNFVSNKEVLLGAHMSEIVAQLQPNSSPSAPADWAGLSSVMMEASNFFRELSKFCVAKTPVNITSPNIGTGIHTPISEFHEKCDSATQTDTSALNMVTSGTITHLKHKVSSISTQTATAVDTEEHLDKWRRNYFNETINAPREHSPLYSQDCVNGNLPCERKLDQHSRASSFQSDKFLPIVVNSTAKQNLFNNVPAPNLTTLKTSLSSNDLNSYRNKGSPVLDSPLPAKSLHLQTHAREVSRNRREACLKKELEILTQEKARVLLLLQQFCSANEWQGNPAEINGENDEDDPLTNGFHSDEEVEGCGSWESVQYLVTYQARLQEACSRVTTKLEKLARQSRVEDYVFHQVNQVSSDNSSCSPTSSEYFPLNHNSRVSMTQHPFCSMYTPYSCHNLSSVIPGRPVIDQTTTGDLPASPSWANLSHSSGSSAPHQRTGSNASSMSQRSRSRTSGERLRPREYQAHLLDIRRSLVAASRSSSLTRSPLSRTSPSPPQRLVPSNHAGSTATFIVNDKFIENIKSSDSRTSSRDSSLDCADSSHNFNSSKSISSDSSAEDIQKLLEECRAARVRAQIEIELAQQQLKSQRLAVRSLETMFKQRT